MSERTLPFTVNLDWSIVNWVKQHRYALIVQNDDKGDQLYTVSMPGKRSQANLNRKPKSCLFTDALVYTIAHWPVPPKLIFLMFFTLIFGDTFFLLIILANCVQDESCGEKLAPISPRGPKFVAQTDFVCIDEDLTIN